MSDCAPSDAQRYFLSYSRADEKFGLRLAQDLRDQGVAIFVDQWDIRPSEHWDRAIERAVGCCRGLVVIISPRSVASDNVMDEVSFALDNGKSVLPVMIEKCVLPLRITRMHLIDATGGYDKALQQCLAELVRPDRLSAPPDQPKAPAPPPLDPDAVAAAKQKLTPILGPIAKFFVEKESSRSASVADLYRRLAEHIESEADRDHFLATAPHGDAPTRARKPKTHEPAPLASSIPSAELESISKALTQYLGPIASVVAKRESRNCSSIADLRQRLADMIPTEHERDAFLRQAGAPAH
jgi:hypothetical protein